MEVKELAEGKDLEEEAQSIFRAAKGYVIALCVEGVKLSSEKMALKYDIRQILITCDR